VNEFALFRGKRAFEVAASLLGVFSKSEEVEIVCKSDGYEPCVVLELGVEASGIEEEEYRGEW
jgi:hypothetical protein